MTHPPTFDDIQKQHQEWLRKLSEIDDVDPDDSRAKVFLDGVSRFLNILAQAGTYTENDERRSLLRDYIRYWSSEINKKTGKFPMVQLQPFAGPVKRRLSRRQVLIGSGIAGGVLVVGGIVYWEAGRNMPPTPTPTPTPTSSPPTATPTASPGAIFVGDTLATGYGMGVNTSGGLTNWVTVKSGEICMAYPRGQSWGAVFITVGNPTQPPRPGKDFSNYHQLSLELRGQAGGESVSISIQDKNQPDDGSETKVPVSGLTTDWKPFVFPLSLFTGTDLHKLYVVTEFVFAGTPETVCARNIQYLL